MKKLLLLLIIPMLAILTGCTQIDTGNVGVESSLGQYKDVEMPSGVYFSAFKTVHEISVKENAIALENLTPKSKDNLTMKDFDVDVYYRIDPTKAADLMIKYAGDVAKPAQGDGLLVGYSLMVRQSREAAYKAAALFDAGKMHTQRTEIAAEMQVALQKALDADAGKGMFIVTNVIIRNVVTDPALEASIQEAAKAEFRIREKEQQILLAKQEAERRRVEAEGEARANHIIAESLTPPLIKLREIEATAKFAKEGTHTVLLGGGATPLVSVQK